MTNTPADNLFDIAQPMIYRCHIHRYYSGLSRLYVRAFKGQQQVPAFYLLFSDVGYVEGPINWQGVAFHIAPHEECVELMLQTGMVGPAILQYPDAYASLTDYAHLYVARTTHSPLRIIASSATLLNDLPADLV